MITIFVFLCYFYSMSNTLKIILFQYWLFILLCAAVFGLSRIKFDEFHKASIILIVDSSASNQKMLPEQKKQSSNYVQCLILKIISKMLRVSEDSYLIYEGTPQAGSKIRKSMEKFTQFDSNEYGTAYGLSLKKAFNHAINMKEAGYIPAVVVIGDLENEGKVENQINWDTLPDEVQEIKR